MPDLKQSGIIGAGTGIVGLVIGLTLGGDKVEVVTDATIKEPLAISAEYIKPATEKTFLRVDPKDSARYVKDTVIIAAHPALKGFNENGVSDYAIAKIMAPGKKYQLLFTEGDTGNNADMKILDATEYTPTDNNFLLSLRPTVSIIEGK